MKKFKHLLVRLIGEKEIELSDPELPWKYNLYAYCTPKVLAKELRQIANWLEAQ